VVFLLWSRQTKLFYENKGYAQQKLASGKIDHGMQAWRDISKINRDDVDSYDIVIRKIEKVLFFNAIPVSSLLTR
jgi:hypothetical protein